ncbi:MAG: hypothetical protein NXI31_12540 [bacterium]|nr:hypothetical protein [bacterium]
MISIPIPTLQDWKSATRLGPTSPRSAALRRVDAGIAAYHRARSEYGRDWEAREIRKLLREWKVRSSGWDRADGRNRSGAITSLEVALTCRLGPPGAARSDSPLAVDLRHGTLHFLAHATTGKLPTNGPAAINDAIDATSDFDDLRNVDTQGISWDPRKKDFAGGKSEGGSGFLSKLYDQLKELIAGLVESAGADAIAAEAGRFVINLLGDAIVKALGALAGQLGAVKDFVKGLVAATKAAIKHCRTRGLPAAVFDGQPRMVVEKVREQIRDAGIDGVKSAVKAAVTAGIGIAGGGIAGTIVSAITTLYTLVTSIWARFRDLRRLKKVFAAAKDKLRNGLHENAAAFHAWYKDVIKDLPILSAYCMAMPMTGGYYGFLTIVSADGTELSYRRLERNYAMFNTVRAEAKSFVKGHGIKIRSADPLVAHSLKVAREESSAWNNAKSGLWGRMKSTAIKLVESAAS